MFQDVKLGDKNKSSATTCIKHEQNNNVRHNRCNRGANVAHFDDWHKRLGYMSQNNMKLVSQSVVFSKNIKQFLCEVCPKAKQHMPPFSMSQISYVYTFELVHVDIWGAYHTETHIRHRYFLNGG